jgi:NAD(P)-dependent dehydrogenase (short-subunit alcohol dehydrogenase family)
LTLAIAADHSPARDQGACGAPAAGDTQESSMADATPKTIVITGASSGIGKATARLFLDKGWNVVATMRNPAAEKDLIESARLKLLALDVQDPEGPKAAVAEAIKAFRRIDVWLNNAGYGAFGPVEAGAPEQSDASSTSTCSASSPACRR